MRYGAVCPAYFWYETWWLCWPFRQHLDGIVTNGEEDTRISFGNDNSEEEGEAQPSGNSDRSPQQQALDFLRESISLDPVEYAGTAAECLQTLVFLVHGGDDEKVACILAQQAATTLEKLGMDVTWMIYESFGHWYKVPDEIDDSLNFLREKTEVPWWSWTFHLNHTP